MIRLCAGIAATMLLALSPSVAFAEDPSALLSRIDQSFSSVPLRTNADPIKLGYSVRTAPFCVENVRDCGWSDKTGVRHYFDIYGILGFKSIWAGDQGASAIGALGIGAARKRDEVLAAIREFSPLLTLECATVPAGTECRRDLGQAVLAIDFDEHDMLAGLTIDSRYWAD